ncbi:hypothetical protein [Catellatospora paridis]|uniref:hypothetical protein n=1 Tax=Catellatospora paridis TaxID=1617086 RepID=UPI0012D44994|nr:hypothetical protein [Catellatospora paridis]
MTTSSTWATDQLPHGRIIVLCGRADDAQAWSDALGADRCLAVALDPLALTAVGHTAAPSGARLAWHHEQLGNLDTASALARAADSHDPLGNAFVITPDPLDPPHVGRRRHIGARRRHWRAFEDKSLVDALWDVMSIPRPPSISTSMVTDLQALSGLLGISTGVVCGLQQVGAAPTGGAQGIWWWHAQPPPSLTAHPLTGYRARLMPLMHGTAVRLHGMVLSEDVVAFPPMEVITLPRPGHGTFLPCGSAATLGPMPELSALTRRIGDRLRETLAYRGAFSVDGILTDDGFLPTDLNTRLTSAMEAAPAALRVQLQAANVLTREGADLDGNALMAMAEQAFDRGYVHTLYGASTVVAAPPGASIGVRWTATGLAEVPVANADGRLDLAPSLRGWTLTARLRSDRLPGGRPLGAHAVKVFRYADARFGTDFGELIPPFGQGGTSVPRPRVAG